MGKINYIIIKSNGNCNLNCTYCYYTHHQLPEWKTAFDIDLLDLTFNKLAGYTDKVIICWHGGEPLLNGLDYFRKAMEIQQKYNLKVENNLQTNGTLIDDDWAIFFKENNFSIGISLDGDEGIHDLNRKQKNNSSYEKTLNGLRLLMKHKTKHGVLCYANSETDSVSIFRHFIKLGIKKIDFLLPIISYQSIAEVDVEKVSNYFIRLFHEWFDLDNPEIKIRIFDDMLSLLLGGKAMNCIFKNQCQGFITIEPNGDVGICENHRINGFDNYLLNKNILTDDFFSIEKESFKRNENINKLAEDCLKCNLLQICNGGCSVERFNMGYKNKNVYCDIYKNIFCNLANKIYVQP
ncbi:MAG: radical SAM protein [Bacteroidota bacterium]